MHDPVVRVYHANIETLLKLLLKVYFENQFLVSELGTVEGPPEEGERPDGGEVAEGEVREGGDGGLVRVADQERGAAVQQSHVLARAFLASLCFTF